jgi:putative endonuclease
MYYIYVLRNLKGRLYIGSAENLERRIKRHQEGSVRWTSGRGPWELAYHETFATRSEAMTRERTLKSGKANQELRKLINNDKLPTIPKNE